MLIELIRTNSQNPSFQELVGYLDKDLAIRDGAEHDYYAQFNKTTDIQHVIVAYENGKRIGCGAFKPFSENEAVEIKRMYVLPEQRGQKVAAHILNCLEKWAKELGYKACVLETGKKQPEAIRLYEREGYTFIPNYGQYIGMDNSVCMRKEL